MGGRRPPCHAHVAQALAGKAWLVSKPPPVDLAAAGSLSLPQSLSPSVLSPTRNPSRGARPRFRRGGARLASPLAAEAPPRRPLQPRARNRKGRPEIEQAGRFPSPTPASSAELFRPLWTVSVLAELACASRVSSSTSQTSSLPSSLPSSTAP